MNYFIIKNIYIYFIIFLFTIECVYIWNFYIPCSAKVKSVNFINTDHFVSNEIPKEGPYLLYIMILSAPANIQQRDGIRSTWGNTVRNYSSVEYSFVIGNVGVSESVISTVLEEKGRFEDIIVLDGVEEDYNKLSRKMLKAITWAGKHIDSVYYLKTDDDCIVVIENLHEVLTKENLPTNKLVLGLINKHTDVLLSGKWAESSWFLCHVYLYYPAGAGYILTQDVVRYITMNSEKLMLYKNEDASLGTWLAPLKLDYVVDNRILPDPTYCKPSDWLLHYADLTQLKYIQYSWVNGERPCSYTLTV